MKKDITYTILSFRDPRTGFTAKKNCYGNLVITNNYSGCTGIGIDPKYTQDYCFMDKEDIELFADWLKEVFCEEEAERKK
jgi:hypothetical protein